jgi:hypothetical protein
MKGRRKMSCGLAIQPKKYGAINVFELLYDGHPLASLVKEGTTLVDYSRRRVFQDFDAAIEFYQTQLAHKNSGILIMGYLPAENTLVVHDSCLSFPL